MWPRQSRYAASTVSYEVPANPDIMPPGYSRVDHALSHDRQFFDIFMLVLGILIGIAAGIFVLARFMAADTQDAPSSLPT